MRVILFLLLFLNLSGVAWYLFLLPKPELEVSLFSDAVDELKLVTERESDVIPSGSEVNVANGSKGEKPVLSTPSVEVLIKQAAMDAHSSTISASEVAALVDEAGVGDEIENEALIGKMEPTIVVEAPIEKACFSLGPFISLDAVKSATTTFTEKEIEVTRRELNERYLSSYQVYLPALPSLVQAKKVIQQLKQKKIKDYYIVLKRGAQRYSISLGLFKDKKHALRRITLVKRKGFKPQLLSRFRNRLLYWLDYTGSEKGVDTALLAGEEGKALQRLERECN